MMQNKQATIYAVLLMLGFVCFGATAAVADDNALIVRPVSAVPSNQVNIGKLVWVDLVTTDPQKAVKF